MAALRALGLRRVADSVPGECVAIVVKASDRDGLYALRGCPSPVALCPDLTKWAASDSPSKLGRWRGDRLSGKIIDRELRALVKAMYPRGRWHLSERAAIDHLVNVSSQYAMVYDGGELVAMVAPKRW